jgi:hypothetical protein
MSSFSPGADAMPEIRIVPLEASPQVCGALGEKS